MMRLFRTGALVGLIAVSLLIAPPGFADDDDDNGEANIGCALRIVRGEDVSHHGGTREDDECRGFDTADVMHGFGGDDLLYSLGSRDIVRGNRGDDLVRGGRKGDLVGGGKGDDRLSGDRGNDRLIGGIGHDDICLGPGRNIVLAEDHRQDRIFGATPNDRLFRDRGDRVLERACPL